jgi:hypothetical protein
MTDHDDLVLSQIWMRTRSNETHWRGHHVYAGWTFPHLPRRLDVEILASNDHDDVTQGVGVAGINTLVSSDRNGAAKRLYAWSSDTDLPLEISVIGQRPTRDKRPSNVMVYNATKMVRNPNPTAWMGNAGMVVRSDGPGAYIFDCADQWADGIFDDLTCRVTFD